MQSPSTLGPALQGRICPILLALFLFGLAAFWAPHSAAAQEKSPQAANSEDTEPRSLTSRELSRAIRILQSEPEQKELLRDLKALARGEEASREAASSRPAEWSWGGLASWFASGADKLQRGLQSREGRILLLQRGIASLVLVLLAVWGWRFLRRRLARTKISTPITLLLLKIFAFGLILFLLLLVWGVDIQAIAQSPALRQLTRSVLVILLVVALGAALWEVFNSYLRNQSARLDGKAMSERRLQTLLPLLRNVVRIVIVVVCLFIIMSELGVNIAPLLAGAGIIGLAVGFGAQTLVKDLINGFLVLAENAINVGDWVILGGHDGQVEGLSIRNVRVRDIYGNVNIVPWSSVETVVNQTMGHGWAVVEPGVAYRENIDEVIGVVREVAAEMREDPEINQDILSDLQILGLIELGDSAVVVRTRFKTTPFRRWFLERDFRRRLKNRFDELGIEIPYPHSTVYFGENKQGRASPARIEVLQRGDDGEDAE